MKSKGAALKIAHVVIPKDTPPNARVGWYSHDQYQVIRDNHRPDGSTQSIPVYRNHLGYERVVTEVRGLEDGPPNWPDAYCVGVIDKDPVRYVG